MKELDAWWPVALADAALDGPQALTLLDRPLVLWRDAMGRPVVQTDRCPHRGARLSLGRVNEGVLQCPYHGWRFDGAGQCVAIPAQRGFQPPDSSAVACHGVREAHGLLWVCLGTSVEAPPALEGLPSRRLIYGPFDVATSAPRAVENFLDTSHFAFVHDGWLGAADHPEVPHHEVTHTTDGRPLIERYPAWQPRASATAEGGGWVDYRYEVLSPYAALLSKRGAAGGPQDSYTIWACPTTPESCRLWFAQYTTDTDTPAQVLHDFQVTIFSQDQPVLESQQPKRLPLSGGEAMGAADRLSAAYRRYLTACGISYGVC